MKHNILLLTPPFTQLNTPYPATAYIKGYLNEIKIGSAQMDLGIETILHLFSSKGLRKVFQVSDNQMIMSDNSRRILAMHETYIQTIDPVVNFLQDQDPTLAHLICERQFLPEASRFEQLEDLEWAFGTMGIRDQARHIATMYLEDISDYIIEVVDPHFGFSRYAERLSIAAHSFDELYTELNKAPSLIAKMMLQILKAKIESEDPSLICLSIPFPGNLFAALTCGRWVKQNYPHLQIVIGGGYPNTELRSINDARIFEFIDYITLDDGETPLHTLLAFLEGKIPKPMLKRTFSLDDNIINYHNGSLLPDVKQENVGTPDYTGLPLKHYLSVIQLTNPMHRLWSDGRWNKLTMAHGCYWGKCTFCDISLDYIKNYEASSAKTIVDRMERLIAQTGETGFHFVDEAAPPSLMKAVALEILKRKLIVTWWTNIRFEKSFHFDLCRLLAASGCIAVSGGLEVASDRLLELIAKGVTVKQVTKVNDNFNQAGIMVHAYLMYGFPTQTAQETIDSLEVVRQLFESGVLQSAFWHRFAMTAHSPVGMYPEKFKVVNTMQDKGDFANNDLVHIDPSGCDHSLFSEGLRKSLYNFMHGSCIDHPLENWFEHEVPPSSMAPDLIQAYLDEPSIRENKDDDKLIWIGGAVDYDDSQNGLVIHSKQMTTVIDIDKSKGSWLRDVLFQIGAEKGTPILYKELSLKFKEDGFEEWGLFWFGEQMEELKRIGLLAV